MIRRLFALAPAPKGRLALAAALAASTIVFGVGLMATAGYLISRAAEEPAILSLTVAIVGVRFFGLGRPVVRYLDRLGSHDLAFRVLGRVRVHVYERIEPLAPAELESYRRGDLLSRVVADVDALQFLYLRGLVPVLAAAAAGCVSVGVAAAFLPSAAIVLALGLAVAGIAVPLAAGAIGRRAARGEAAARGELSAELVELLTGAGELQVYGRGAEAMARVRETDGTLSRLAARAAAADGVGDGLRLLVTGATATGVLALAVRSHADGGLSRVMIATLALLALASFEGVQPLSQAARELASTVAAGRRVVELTDREPAVRDPADPAELQSGPVAVALEDVRARYAPGDPPALDGLTLRLGPGQHVAVVGPSGAGKSTIVNLLLRFLDPEAGRVTIGGRDLRELRQEDVRRTVAVAGQDSHLFSTSIRENLRLARPDAGDAEIESALRRARLWDWVAGLPDGLDTLVGEQGRELSGGQRGRLVVARALLANAPVLVLDEPTAHLDTETATSLLDDVLDNAGDASVLLITHRRERLERMDEVVELPA
ncbi:MAG TPA: thiol reductant ABC exporter subunit CydC [Gaiellaceae bacterium]|nr:thiol reductant ABC exporter subunit CydC [Gaiellaceae bacterium]